MCRMTFKAMATAVLCGWALMLSAPVLRAAVKLPNLLSDGMVLQQGMNVNIWGTAEPGESVSVSFQGQKVSGVAGVGGEWKVKLDPLHAGGPFTMTIAGNNTITLHDVLVGEVWVCSGQSNMEMALVAFAPWSKGVTNYEDEIAHSDNPNLRMFAVEKVVATRPQNDVNGSWVAAGPQTVSSWSAVAYFFGRDLQRTLNVPIGLINSSWGGTPAESWTSRGALESNQYWTPAQSSLLLIPSFSTTSHGNWCSGGRIRTRPKAKGRQSQPRQLSPTIRAAVPGGPLALLMQ